MSRAALPAASGAPAYTERELLLGPRLLATLPPEWSPWLTRRRTLLQAALAALQSAQAEAHATRLAALRQELLWTEEALAAFAQKAEHPSEGDEAR